ncbi:hypothetical protein [Moorena producens]|uniref:hypothetical protein n=1 Tax=Moorena producens TaxID=1155739 RepID=UPI003C781520
MEKTIVVMSAVSAERSVVSRQRSVLSSQQSVVSLFYSKVAQPPWHRLPACELTHKLIDDG